MAESPLYMQIYQDYVDDIQAGIIAGGTKLPSETDIAAQYNVSRITSRRAMEMLQSEGFIERTPGRGSFVCERSDSIMNNKASSTLTGTEPRIGLIVPTFSDNFAMELVMGAEQGARDHGYDFFLRRSLSQPEDESYSIKKLHDAGCSGLILMPQHNDFFNAYLLRLILDGYPVVIIDRQMKGIDTSFIGSDNYDASINMTLQMLALGHHHIAYLSNPVQSATTLMERYVGFREAYQREKIFWNEDLFFDFSFDGISHLDITPEIAPDIEKVMRFIMDHPEITCIYATEYSFAQLAVSAIMKLGFRVPEDISVVGYDGPSSETGNPFLTRVIQPQAEMGWQGVSILDRIIRKEESNVNMVLNSRISNGFSLGPVRNHKLTFKS